jgi:O-antigen ligase
MDKFIDWYGRGLFVAVVVAVAFLGIGGLEVSSSGGGLSAWSVSRTTFFFWLFWKLLIAIRTRQCPTDLFKQAVPVSLFLFFFIVAISLLPDFHQAGDFRYFAFGCAHALMIMDLCQEKRRSYLLLLLLGLFPGLLVVRGVLHDPSVLSLDHTRRLGFPLDHPNTAGYLFSMSVPLAVGLAITKKGWRRGATVLSAATQICGLALTYSRGGWIGGMTALLFLGMAQKSWKAISCLLIGLSLVFAIAAPLRNRLLTLRNPQADIAMNERMQVMQDAVRLGQEHPVLGIGYGRGRLKEALRPAYRGTANESHPIWHAHNVYVELFAETGILGLGAFLWLLGRSGFEILRRAYSETNENRALLLSLGAAWIAAAVTGLGDVSFYHHETRIFFFTLLALAFCLAERAAISDERCWFARLT